MWDIRIIFTHKMRDCIKKWLKQDIGGLGIQYRDRYEDTRICQNKWWNQERLVKRKKDFRQVK